MTREVVVVSAVRTAIGTFGGSLKDVPPTVLGATVVRESLARANVAVAKANLDKLHISATFDGMAGIVQVTPGEMVTPGQAIVALTNEVGGGIY